MKTEKVRREMDPELVRKWKQRWAARELSKEKEVKTKTVEYTLDAELWREWLVDRGMPRERRRRFLERQGREAREREKR